MKKAIATLAGSLGYFSLAAPAFAQLSNVSLDPCTNNGGNTAVGNQLCAFQASEIGQIVGNIVISILILAAVIALFFLIVGGIRWITSGGDKAKVESARNTIIAAIVGLVIAFLAFFILQVVLGFFNLELSNLVLPGLRG